MFLPVRTSRRWFTPAIITLSIVSLAGCSKDNPVDTPGTKATTPGIGTIYTYHGTTTDIGSGLGQAVVDRLYTMTVIESGASYGGRTNLVRMYSGNGSTYYQYEANGDLTWLYYLSSNGVPVDSAWVNFPYGSKGKVTLPSWDRVLGGSRVQSSGSYTWLRSERITIGSETFDTEVVVVESSSGLGSPGKDPVMTETRTDTVWYAPRIFNIVKQSGVQKLNNPFEPGTYHNVAVLESYSLR